MKILKNPHISSLSDLFPWQKKFDWGDFDKKKFPGFSDLNTSTVKKSR